MRFALASSPFRNIHKFADEDILDYLDPLLRELAHQFRVTKSSTVPPFALIFGSTEAIYLNGYSYSTPDSFVLQAKYDTRLLNAKRVVLCTEVGSVAALGDPEAMLVTEVQSESGSSIRCAYDLLRPGRKPVTEDWKLPSEVVEDPLADPVEQMITQASNSSVILGPSYFFTNMFEPR